MNNEYVYIYLVREYEWILEQRGASDSVVRISLSLCSWEQVWYCEKSSSFSSFDVYSDNSSLYRLKYGVTSSGVERFRIIFQSYISFSFFLSFFYFYFNIQSIPVNFNYNSNKIKIIRWFSDGTKLLTMKNKYINFRNVNKCEGIGTEWKCFVEILIFSSWNIFTNFRCKKRKIYRNEFVEKLEAKGKSLTLSSTSIIVTDWRALIPPPRKFASVLTVPRMFDQMFIRLALISLEYGSRERERKVVVTSCSFHQTLVKFIENSTAVRSRLHSYWTERRIRDCWRNGLAGE